MTVELKRKLFHLLGVIFPLMYYFSSLRLTLTILIIINFITIALDINRHFIPKVQNIIDKIFISIIRPHEYSGTGNLSGMSYMLFGFLLTAIFFQKEQVILSWLILIFADSIAAILGKKYGTPTFYGKSFEGSAMFFCFSMMIAVICHVFLSLHFSFLRCIFAILITTIAEFYSKAIKIDDNLLIPIVFCLFC
jgi:dolichol kinase